jgi:predicted nucleic acid-binding protein
MLIVDASVAIKWFKQEHDSPLAELVPLADALTAPEFMLAELCNAGGRRTGAGCSRPRRPTRSRLRFALTVAHLRPLEPLASRAVVVARALDHPVYDCFYLAHAEREAVPLVTADARLLAKLKGTPWAAHVRDLASFGPTP